jgi:MerR family transcriptional regulator, redox-sensitive transcriptional activator SoxR
MMTDGSSRAMQVTKGLSIGQVAKRAGLRPSAIRYYEASGLLPEPVRVSGWRRYGNSVFTALAAIELAQQAGFSLEEIRTLLRGFSRRTAPSARWAMLARKKLPEIDALIARAHAMKDLLMRGIECRCVGIDACPIVAERVQSMTRNGSRDRIRRELPPRSAVGR